MVSFVPENIRLRCGCQEIEWPYSLEDFGTQLALAMDLPAFEYDSEKFLSGDKR